MKKIVWVYLLGLISLNSGWCVDITDVEELNEESTLELSVDADETETQKFSNLVKSTMDLMGPDLESTDKAEVETVSQAPTP